MVKTSLKKRLEGIFNEEEVEKINRSFEIIGDIAIIEIRDEMKKHAKKIAKALMDMNSNIKTVLMKSGIHEGEFRTQKMDYLMGEKKYETIYTENGIKLKLDVEKVYFSSKLGTERMNLSSQISEGARVLVMFSGCGPYTFNILRKQPNIKRIDSIELNPIGYEYSLKNLELNKNLLKKSKEFNKIIEEKKKNGEYISEKEIIKELNKKIIEFHNGDVREIINNKLSSSKFDYIFMPLPKDAEMFLDCAFKVADKNCIIHMYDFLHENDFPSLSENKILEASKIYKRKVEILSTRKVGQYSPRKFRVCCDFKILD